jgi:hypothetical protein
MSCFGYEIPSESVYLPEILGEYKTASVLEYQSSPGNATPAKYGLTVGKANQIIYGRKYDQKCPQLITGYIAVAKRM